jgi:hypothetical protein
MKIPGILKEVPLEKRAEHKGAIIGRLMGTMLHTRAPGWSLDSPDKFSHRPLGEAKKISIPVKSGPFAGIERLPRSLVIPEGARREINFMRKQVAMGSAVEERLIALSVFRLGSDFLIQYTGDQAGLDLLTQRQPKFGA